jgi:hypothetical protein
VYPARDNVKRLEDIIRYRENGERERGGKEG